MTRDTKRFRHEDGDERPFAKPPPSDEEVAFALYGEVGVDEVTERRLIRDFPLWDYEGVTRRDLMVRNGRVFIKSDLLGDDPLSDEPVCGPMPEYEGTPVLLCSFALGGGRYCTERYGHAPDVHF